MRDDAGHIVLRADTADAQLADIVSYVAEVAGKRSAFNLLDRLEEACGSPGRFPRLGLVPRRRSLARRGYRMLVVGDYLIFYKVYDAERHIVVHGFFHGARDYEAWL